MVGTCGEYLRSTRERRSGRWQTYRWNMEYGVVGACPDLETIDCDAIWYVALTSPDSSCSIPEYGTEEYDHGAY